MAPVSNRITEDAFAASTLARLDVQEVELGVPIREFLTTSGCVVFINKDPPTTADYHIIYGDESFVKHILSVLETYHNKTLIILSGETAQTAENISHKKIGKVALVGTHFLSSRQTRGIFAFFFTSRKFVEIFEETQRDTTSKELEKERPSKNRLLRSIEDDDRLRIADVISRTYWDQSHERLALTRRKGKKSVQSTIIKIFMRLKINALYLAAFTIVLPFIWYFTSVSVAAWFLYYGSHQLINGHADAAAASAVAGHQWTNRAAWTLSYIALPFQLVGTGGWFRNQERVVSLLRNLVDAGQSAAILVASGKDMIASILEPFGTSTAYGSSAVASDRLKQELLVLGGTLGLAQGELDIILRNEIFPFNISAIKKRGEAGRYSLSHLRLIMGELKGFVSLYPAVAGFKDKKVYLVLLQNSMELRPTGGFIGSVASVTFSEGTLLDFVIQDVYDLDGQLKGHVDPPEQIRQLLQQERWYLRDSNWDPDFAVSAHRAAWFYEKEAGHQVDGVIAINVPFLIDILKAVGSVEVSDYNDRVTAENFFGKSLYYTQANFFPGSTQKKDFLGALANALLTKVTSNKSVQPPILSAIAKALRSGNLLLWFTDPQIQQVVEQLGWAGRVPAGNQCKGQELSSCLADRAMFVEANLSVNKVNYFLKRNIRHRVVLAEDGSVTETVSVLYTNNSPSDDRTGGGTYRAYGRLIVPADAVVESVTLDGVALSEPSNKVNATFEPPYLVNENTYESSIFGVALDVPRGQQRQLVLSYRRRALVVFVANRGVYDLYLQKQPGLINTDLVVDVSFPIFWQPETTGGKLSFLANQARLEYNMPLLQNEQFKIVFTK